MGMSADYQWSKQPDIRAGLERARLNASRGIMLHTAEPQAKASMNRYLEYVRPGLAQLQRLATEANA